MADLTRCEQLANARRVVRWTANSEYYKAQIGKALVLYPNGSAPAIYEWCQASDEDRLRTLSLAQVRGIIRSCEKSIGLKKEIMAFVKRDYADELNKAMMRREHNLSTIEQIERRIRATASSSPRSTDMMLKLQKMKDMHMSALETIIGLRRHGEVNITNNVTVETDSSLVAASRKAKALLKEYKDRAIEVESVISTDNNDVTSEDNNEQ